jgi:hypothetical protein
LAIMTDTTRPRMIAEKREKQPPSHNQDLFANLQSLHLRNIKKRASASGGSGRTSMAFKRLRNAKEDEKEMESTDSWRLLARRACESLSPPD